TMQNQPMPPFPKLHQAKPGDETALRPRPRYHAPLYEGSNKLARKVALITGGDSGIDRAVAVLFAREGADVAITYLPPEEDDALETCAAVEVEGRKALALVGDVSDPAMCQALVRQTVHHFGKLDILVNNAAYQQHVKAIEDLSLDQWEYTFRVNIFGYFYMVKAALPYMETGGVILNTGSVTGINGSE